MRRIIVEEAHWAEVRDLSVDMALLPWGATEPHNLHLPYGTDTYCSRDVAITAVSLIPDEEDLTIAILPAVPYGVNTGQRDLNLCMSIPPSVQYLLLESIVSNLRDLGIPRLMVINGHGGNDFKPQLRELQQKIPEVFCCLANWWTIPQAEDYFSEPGDHAGELETSCMMHLHPEFVLPLSSAGEGMSIPFAPNGLADRSVWAPRHWRSATRDTGVGNPAASTAEKGERFFQDAARELAGYIAAIAAADPKSLYE